MSSCSNQAPQGQATIPMTAAMQNKVLTQNLKDVRLSLIHIWAGSRFRGPRADSRSE